MAPRFCTACGSALSPGDAFCSSCGARARDEAVRAGETPHEVGVLEDPESPDLQPGETEVGSWTVNHPSASGSLVNGRLTVSSHRLLFRPLVSGISLYRIFRSQTKGWKKAHTIVLPRDRIVAIRTEKGFLKKNVLITAVDGRILVFNCGPRSVDLVARALGGSNAG